MRFSFFFCLLTFSLFLSPASTRAQLPNGSIAPDFTITDIDGEVYHLYDMLEDGKIVIIDFFATWCGPCWTYHENKDLENIWKTYGPSGSDELFVLYIEADPVTTLNNLVGVGNNTFGDYTSGITYPIFNDASLVGVYDVNYWPTVYMICPNKRTTEIGQVTFEKATELLKTTCSPPLGTNNGEVLQFESSMDPFCQEEEYIPEIRFQNLGSNPITHASFDVLVNGTIAHTNCLWEGYLTPFATTNVAFAPVNLFVESEITVKITTINGVMDNTPPNNSLSGLKTTPKSYDENIIFEIETDHFGYETYWELRDDNDQLLSSGGNSFVVPGGPHLASELTSNPDGYYLDDKLYTHEISLPGSGCYHFYIIDDYGDGICCAYGDGHFRMKDKWGNIIFEGGENFSELHRSFEVFATPTATTEVLPETASISVFPNPADEEIYLNLSAKEAQATTVRLYNSSGQLAVAPWQFHYPGSLVEEQYLLHISQVPAGLYLLQIQTGEVLITKKIIID